MKERLARFPIYEAIVSFALVLCVLMGVCENFISSKPHNVINTLLVVILTTLSLGVLLARRSLRSNAYAIRFLIILSGVFLGQSYGMGVIYSFRTKCDPGIKDLDCGNTPSMFSCIEFMLLSAIFGLLYFFHRNVVSYDVFTRDSMDGKKYRILVSSIYVLGAFCWGNAVPALDNFDATPVAFTNITTLVMGILMLFLLLPKFRMHEVSMYALAVAAVVTTLGLVYGAVTWMVSSQSSWTDGEAFYGQLITLLVGIFGLGARFILNRDANVVKMTDRDTNSELGITATSDVKV